MEIQRITYDPDNPKASFDKLNNTLDYLVREISKLNKQQAEDSRYQKDTIEYHPYKGKTTVGLRGKSFRFGGFTTTPSTTNLLFVDTDGILKFRDDGGVLNPLY